MQKYEYGYSKLSVQMFLRICSSLHTSPIYFLGSVSFLEGGGVIDRDVEARLLNIVRSIKNLKVKARVVELVEAVVSGSVDVADAE
jgi:hypothetical protein